MDEAVPAMTGTAATRLDTPISADSNGTEIRDFDFVIGLPLP
jgi:hypothetical protein